MEDGVLGHLGHHAVEPVVAETNPEKNIAIIHHLDMVGKVVLVQVMTHRDVTPEVAQVSTKRTSIECTFVHCDCKGLIL